MIRYQTAADPLFVEGLAVVAVEAEALAAEATARSTEPEEVLAGVEVVLSGPAAVTDAAPPRHALPSRTDGVAAPLRLHLRHCRPAEATREAGLGPPPQAVTPHHRGARSPAAQVILDRARVSA